MTETQMQSSQANTRLPWFCFLLLLAVGGPQFVCMPVTNDVSYYDIQARTALGGGVLYRDMVEPNLPGVVWVHMAVRSIAGWSTEALRAFDLCLYLVVASLFGMWTARTTRNRKAGVWTACILALVYLSVSEWCHVQRDVWLLFPVVLALHLRQLQIGRLACPDTHRGVVFRWAMLEGALLGCGVWIKPHVVIIAFCVWLASIMSSRRSRLIDLAGMLLGGLLVGALGITWLVITDAWAPFVDMMLHWNPEYVRASRELWELHNFRSMLYRLMPFCVAHVPAVPLALASLRDLCSEDRQRQGIALFAVLYLSSCAQVLLLQHPSDYIHLPLILLATAFMALWVTANWQKSPAIRMAACAMALLFVMMSPVKDLNRIKLAGDCFREGSSGPVRNQLAKIPYPDWQDLEKVEQFLTDHGVKDGQLTCWSNDLVHLYRDLNLRPSTRFVYTETHRKYFRSRQRAIDKALNNSGQKYVLTNLMAGGLLADQARSIGPEGPLGYPPGFPPLLRQSFPWELPIAFRSGSLVVHRVPAGYTVHFATK